MTKPGLTLIERFMLKVEKTDTCWLWTGSQYGGYGRMSIRAGESVAAHQLAYTLFVCPIPRGLWVLHNCPGGDNPLCVNPAHLWLGTRSDNQRDAYQKGRSNFAANPELLPRGEYHHKARLTWDKVRELRRRAQTEDTTHKQYAVEYGVSQATITHTLNGRYWREGATPSLNLNTAKGRGDLAE